MGETAALPSLRFPVYPSFMRIQTLICAVLLVAAFTRGARSALVPPQQLPTGDSAGTVLEKGIEFVRLTEHVDGHFAMGKALARASALWKTDWQTPEGGGDRIRQDGHWYVGTSRGVLRSVDLWLAAQGEHFDDRPFGSSAASSPSFQIPPANPSLEASPFMSAQDVSAVRILRGGGGVSVNPWAPLRVDAGVGSVQDRRIGSVRSGLGVWSHAVVDHWNTGGYDQTFALDFNRETPREHANEDLSGHYGIFREFFPGNSNRGEITAGTLSRDVYLDPTHVARRQERNLGVRDVLHYVVTRGLQVEMGGDVSHQKTETSQSSLYSTFLEENQAGFNASVGLQRESVDGTCEASLRTVTQTIRGDILQGKKADVGLRGTARLPGRSRLAVHLSVSKYSLDTRSTTNYDDRDQLLYTVEAAWSKTLFGSALWQIQSVTQLDHLVYLFRQSSANNRWTRFFLLGSSLRHQPTRRLSQTFRGTVSATYQSYDFETDPRTMRSTVQRRLTMSDSIALRTNGPWTFGVRFSWQQDEFGRLFWRAFEEERSDEVSAVAGALDVIRRVSADTRAGVGFLWDVRRGKRFADANQNGSRIFQDVRFVGPTALLETLPAQSFFLRMSARLLRQRQLEKPSRWIVMGDVSGGWSW